MKSFTFLNLRSLFQCWGEAVRLNSSVIVFHSGNSELIGIRHRESQTLYLSDVIETYNTTSPAYEKVQVGLYFSLIRDAVDRMQQTVDARMVPALERTRSQSATISATESFLKLKLKKVSLCVL